MSKLKSILLIFIFVLFFSFLFYFFFSKKNEDITPLSSITTVTPTAPTAITTFSKYTDPSGFSFQYPQDIKLSNRDLSSSDYASLELTNPNASGKISFKVSDSTFTTLDSWIKQNISSQDVKNTTLANIPAVQFESQNKQMLIAIDNGGALFFLIVDYQNKKDYWTQVESQIVKTFAFAPPQISQSTDNSANSDTNIVDEGEEEVQ